jgi:hypothetical protein
LTQAPLQHARKTLFPLPARDLSELAPVQSPVWRSKNNEAFA